MGQPLMPWQELVAMVGGEIDPATGLPAYREVILTVPRQSGKTTLVLSWEVQRAIGWGAPQRIVYSAQTGNDARRKLVEDQVPLLKPYFGTFGIKRILQGMGNEAVEFHNGSRIVLLASDKASGHGKTIDLGIEDELFADLDDRRDGALVPAMATKPAAQIVVTSTMGTDESIALNAKVEAGRKAVEEGRRSGIAYFEWSAKETDDPDDPDVWRRCHPALGHTISEDVIRHARLGLSDAEFRRAFLNIKDSRRADPVIDAAAWRACQAGEPSQIVGRKVFAFDVSPDRQFASIAAAGRSSLGEFTHIEVIDNAPGTAWVVPRLAQLMKHSPLMILCDQASPAAALMDECQVYGIEVTPSSTRDHIDACGAFYDAAHEGTIVHLGQPSLDAAVNGADRREVSDAWLWSRKNSSVDISPLVACTLARWGHHKRKANLWVI